MKLIHKVVAHLHFVGNYHKPLCYKVYYSERTIICNLYEEYICGDMRSHIWLFSSGGKKKYERRKMDDAFVITNFPQQRFMCTIENEHTEFYSIFITP